jgi:hypothetical protein
MATDRISAKPYSVSRNSFSFWLRSG